MNFLKYKSLTILATIVLLLNVFNELQAQDNRDIANAKFDYAQAKKAYEAGDYETCLNHLKSSESYAGNNVLIQYLRCKALYEKKDFELALKEIDTFFNIAPEEAVADTRYMGIIKIDRDIRAYFDEETAYYEKAMKTSDLAARDSYLNKFEHGRYHDEVLEAKNTTLDKDFWKKTKSSSEPEAFYEYIQKYPNGIFIDSARYLFTLKNDAAFEECQKEMAFDACRYYMSNFPHGDHLADAKKELNHKNEIKIYKTALGSSNHQNCRTYLLFYPQGQYVDEMRNKYEKILTHDAKEYSQKMIYTTALYFVKLYKAEFPSGPNLTEINELHKQCLYSLGIDSYKSKYWQSAHTYLLQLLSTNFPQGENMEEVDEMIKKSAKRIDNSIYR